MDDNRPFEYFETDEFRKKALVEQTYFYYWKPSEMLFAVMELNPYLWWEVVSERLWTE